MSWPTARLGALGQVITGSTPKSSEIGAFGSDIPFVTPGDLDGANPLTRSERYLSRAAAMKARLLPPGSVLISCIGNLGKSAIAGTEVVTNQQINAVVFDQTKIFPKFGYYACRTLKRRMEVMAPATTLPIFSKSKFEALEIPVPPLEEQRRIAAILDQTEELRANRRAAIALLDQLPQAIFLEMFGDPVSNPMGWPVTKLNTLGSLDRGVSKHRPRNAPELLGGIHPLIQTGDVANSDGYIRSYTSTYSDIGLEQSKKWPTGTLCITIAANIAKTGILTFDACFPDSVVGFTPHDSESTQFVRVWLSFLQKTLEDSAPESAQKNINLDILRNFPVPVPPLEMRKEFATRIENVFRTKASHQSSLAELNALFESLQAAVFGVQHG